MLGESPRQRVGGSADAGRVLPSAVLTDVCAIVIWLVVGVVGGVITVSRHAASRTWVTYGSLPWLALRVPTTVTSQAPGSYPSNPARVRIQLLLIQSADRFCFARDPFAQRGIRLLASPKTR
jgi:hypothetical protein